MKNYHKLAMIALGAAMLTGCADTDIDYKKVDKPATIAEYEYLDNYGPLKTYIDRSAHPNFLLGSGVTVSEYNNMNLQYRVTNSNFDIMTAGNAMKYSSIVADNGDMDFSKVEKFVENASAAGMQIYGHTLCWHSQQNVKWLTSLIKDKEIEVDPNQRELVIDAKRTYQNDSEFPFYVMGYKPEIINGILTVPEYPGSWYQFFVMDGLSYTEGTEYTVTAKIRGSKEGQLNVQLGDWGALKEGTLKFTDDWSEAQVTLAPCEVTKGFVVFQPGNYDGKLEIEWVQVSHSEAPQIKVYYPLVSNGDAEGDDVESFWAVEGNGLQNARIVDNPDGAGHVFEVNLPASPVESWDAQFFIKSNTVLNEGDKVRVSFRYKCTDTRNIDTQAHGQPTNYHHWSFIGTLNAAPEWKDHTWTGTITGEQAGADGCVSIAFNLSSVSAAGKFWIDDIVFEIEKSGNTIPLTPEEKCEILTAEMGRWIEGMMKATGGYVKAWDVVNEAISGGPWGQRYDLQHDKGDANDFFWQDYLGDNFVRVPVKFARQYYAENGGNPEDLKLFVNDYNLESDWDNNQKLKSLISWIEQWESDGVTKIDGIGSQMHISYYMNPTTQKSKEDHIVKMLELMAATGKLCRITELDMGICDETGNALKTEDLEKMELSKRIELEKKMGDFYKFIIEKYYEIIPVAQQHGITHWCQTDAQPSSGWRGGEPVGLWNLNYSRKPAFAGFADGLSK